MTTPDIRIHTGYRLTPVASLREDPRNVRRHSEHQIQALAAAIREYGFTRPLLIGPDGTVRAGHGALAAAKRLGMREVPTIALDGLSEGQIRAYVLADNRLAELSEWDTDGLRAELDAIAQFDPGLIDLTGFDLAEITRSAAAAIGAATAALSPPPAPAPDQAQDPSADQATAAGTAPRTGPLTYQILVDMDQPTKRLHLRLKRQYQDVASLYRAAIEALDMQLSESEGDE